MRFGLVHRVLLDTLVALGMLSLVATGEFERVVSAGFLVALALAFFVPTRWQDVPGWRLFGTYSPVGLLALQLVRWSQGGSPLSLAVEFAAVLQVLRVATRRGAAHDQQIIALSLLHLVAATVLGAGLAYALCFIGFVLVTPPALLLSHLRREVEGNYRQGARDRTGLPVDVPRILRSRRVVSRGFVAFVCCLSIPVFLFTALLFITFPRVGLSLLLLEPSRPTRMVGFSDHVDLGRIGTLHSDPTIAMRVTYPTLPHDPPLRIALYLRGTAFDRYDNQSWKRTQNQRSSVESLGNVFALTRYPNTYSDPSLTVDLEPIDPPVLFLPEHATALELIPIATQVTGQQPTVQFGPEGELRYGRLDDRRGARYRVYLDPSVHARAGLLSAEDRARYLELPSDFSDKIGELARTWASPESRPEQVVQRILDHLRHDYTYDLNGPSGSAKRPLEHFLFVSKRGHCEFYSTAMALMLRTLGIPTRNVTGFAGATYNRFGKFYAVRQGDAHSWVEAWLEPIGWQRFDPTPAATPPVPTLWARWVASTRDVIEATSQRWNRHVERYDLRQQIELVSSLRRHVSSLSGGFKWSNQPGRFWWWLGLAPLLFWALRRLSRRSQRPRSVVERPDPRVDEIVRLYRLLERHLEHLGIGRPSGTPPLTHARALAALGHPVAPELLELTKCYLEVRFGGVAFDTASAAEFARRVTRLRRIPEGRHQPRAVA
jgi:protein-glutamine gamma-glutamyltransferase